jgi:cytochrome c551/c552
MYDWIRGWIKAVTLRPNGDLDKMEPFMPSTKLSSPIDMEVGPDGKIYLLEYGSGWFAKNPDAALSRIDYNAGELQKAPAPPSPPGAPGAPKDSAEFVLGHQQSAQEGHEKPDSISIGKNFVETLDCKACHKVSEKSVGPAYVEIANKYSENKKADIDHLVDKIINGGTGVWGETAMPAHPALPPDDVKKMVDYILSLK